MAEDHESFSKGELEAYMAGLRNAQPGGPPAIDSATAAQLKEAVKLFKAADQMDKEGPRSSTPLATLLNHDLVVSNLIAIMMSPVHSDFDKARLIAAVTIVGLQEYNIVI